MTVIETTTNLDEDFVRRAGHAARFLPVDVHDALVDFADDPGRSGYLLLSGLPVGNVPATPPHPAARVEKDLTSEFTLLTVARRLGQPVGYRPEHGGDIVQNLVPTRATADHQTSTSSKVTLDFHTETAFHPHLARYLVLLCLRGDPSAVTTLCSVHDVLDHLSSDVIDVLWEPRFRCGIDESFVGEGAAELGPPRPILSGDPADPRWIFDSDLMVGVDAEADDAISAVREAIGRCAQGVVLAKGDVLVVDNAVAVHGRSPFHARFDGSDRWLQRAFVVSDLAPSANERDGRVITTRF